MPVDPYTHFPRAVQHLSEQFGIQFQPRGLSLPSGEMFGPTSVELDDRPDSTKVGATILSPDHVGNLHHVDLTPENNEVRSYVNLVGDGGRSFKDAPEALVRTDPSDWGPQAYELIGNDHPWGDGSPAKVLDHLPKRAQFFTEEALEGDPVHPWVQQYNHHRLNMSGAHTEGGKYLGGSLYDERVGRMGKGSEWEVRPWRRYLLDPPTGEVVRELDPEEYKKHDFDW